MYLSEKNRKPDRKGKGIVRDHKIIFTVGKGSDKDLALTRDLSFAAERSGDETYGER